MPARTIALGDIHGCSTALATLLDAIEPAAEDTLIALGDYIDRGPDSRGVLDQLLDLGRRCRLIPLLGNHEALILLSLSVSTRSDCNAPYAHLPAQAIATARRILIDREKHLLAVVEAFLQSGDRTTFKDLLIPCAAHPESAWRGCGLLAGAYPAQASAIAQAVLPFARAAT